MAEFNIPIDLTKKYTYEQWVLITGVLICLVAGALLGKIVF